MLSGVFKCWTLVLTMLFSLGSVAQNKNMMNFGENVKLDKKQMRRSIDMLMQSGRITEEQAAKAKKKLENYSNEDIKALKNQALQKMKDSGGAQNMIPAAGSASIEKNQSSGSQKSENAQEKAKPSQMQEKLKESSSYKKAMDYLNSN